MCTSTFICNIKAIFCHILYIEIFCFKLQQLLFFNSQSLEIYSADAYRHVVRKELRRSLLGVIGELWIVSLVSRGCDTTVIR